MVTILIAMFWAIALGAGIRRLTWPALLESASAIVSALGKMYPRALVERALVLCALAAIWGALAFGVGAAVRPVS